jgi:hypothetical protein
MVLDAVYPCVVRKRVILVIVIIMLTFGNTATALSLSNFNSGNFHGISYGYSVNLQSTSTYPVTTTSESQGVNVIVFSPVLAGPVYRGNYFSVNPVSTQAFFKKMKYEYSGNPQPSIPVTPDYIQPFPGSDNINIVTSIDYVDMTNQRVHYGP